MISLAFRHHKHVFFRLINSHSRKPFIEAPLAFPIYQRFYEARAMASSLKRKAEKPASPSKAKKAKIVIPEYHLTPSRQNESGEIIWPARENQIERAREIIKEW